MTEQEIAYLDDLLDVEAGLSGWELDFIENLDTQYRDRDLSEKQADTLRQIHEQVLG